MVPPGASAVPIGLIQRRVRDRRIFWGWLAFLFAIPALGVGAFTLNVALIVVGLGLAGLGVVLIRLGWKGAWKSVPLYPRWRR